MNRHSTIARLGPVLGSLLALAAFGCGDKGMPTQPLTPPPSPTQGPSMISMDVTLSPTNPPPAVKHAALATVVVKETGGRSVQLTSMRAMSADFNGTPVQVGGFAPMELAPNQTTRFEVTLTTSADIPCANGVEVAIYTADQAPAVDDLGCEATDWPF